MSVNRQIVGNVENRDLERRDLEITAVIVLGTAAIGAFIGGMIAGPAGIAIGALVGAFIGALGATVYRITYCKVVWYGHGEVEVQYAI